MFDAILFDLDGTLVDTDPTHLRVWQEVLAPYGIAVDAQIYRHSFSGRLNPPLISELLPHLSPEEVNALSDRKEARFREVASTLRPLAGLEAVLDWCDALAIKRALVTNAPAENARFLLDVLKLSARFGTVVLGEELPRAKPDSLPYWTALDRLGVRAERSLAFEDSPSGMRSAVGAGILSVGIATSQTPERLVELGAALVVDDYADARLWALLRG